MRNAREKTKRAVRTCEMLLAGTLLTLALVISTSVQAFAAADSPSLNLNQRGSITLTLYSDEEKSTVSDGIVTLYRVANLELDDGNMVYTLTNSFSGSGVSLDDISAPLLAETLAQYAADQSLIGVEAEIASDGTVSFDDLELGLYLIVQTTASTGYYAVDPFLVSVPLAMDGVWAYDVDASPKVEVLTEESPPQPDEPQEEETDLEPPDTGLSRLPQTGQLNWPIPVMAVSGAVLFIVGSVRQHRQKKRTGYAA